METHLARVVLENAQDNNFEVVIDLVVEGGKAKPGLVYFGVWLDKNAQATCPFVMDPHGQIDFGTGYDGADRFYETDLNSVDLGVGQQVFWRIGEFEQTFVVTGITQLV